MKPNSSMDALNLIDLALRMGPGVARIGNEVADRAVGDSQSRR